MKMKKKHVDLSAISHYLKCGQYPDGLTDSDKRGVRKRSKDFRLKDDDLYFVRDPKSGDSSGGESDSGEKAPSEMVWRKVLHQPDPIRKAFLECHVDDQGNHRSYDKTLKEFSDLYYLSKTIETVRTYIKECPICQAYRYGTCVQIVSAGKTPSERAEHVEELMAALPFSENVGEVITHFWQKVEVDLFGPYKVTGGNLVYVVVCLDSYSLWPEAKIIEYVDDSLPVVDILQFVLSLIARYGMMHTLTFRKDSFSRKDINARFDLLTDEENSINVEFGRCQDTDEIWKDLECDIGKFTKNYAKDWSKCIDLCLMPHRISRPELAEYTPAFLVHNREPRLPSSISYRQPNSNLDPNLSDVQMQATQSRLMRASKALSEVHLTNSPEKASSVNADSSPMLCCSSDEDLAETPLSTAARTKDAKSKLNHSNMDVDNSTPATSSAASASSNKKSTQTIAITPASTRSKKSVTISVERSTRSQRGRGGGASTRSTRKRAAEIENAEMETEGGETENEDGALSGTELSSGRRGRKQNYSDVVNRYSPKKGNDRKKRENRDIPLDDYYSALKLYIQHKRYPVGIKDDYKRVIRKMANSYVIEKDVLYYKSGTKLKETVMDELERFKLLKEAHVLPNGTHLGRFRTLASLNDYYWKGMTVDALALVKTCPVCELSNERRKAEVDPNPAQESFLNLIKEAEAEPMKLKEDDQNRLYECLKQSLIGGNKKTANMTPEEIEYVEKESDNYKVSADGLLYRIAHQGIDGLRKVIMNAEEKNKILTEIHLLRTGIHRGVERTKAILHGMYYWVGINRDLREYLEKCCSTRVFPEDKKQKSQEDKLAKFAEYFMMDLNQTNTQEILTSTLSSDKKPENILTSVGLKEKTPSTELKNNSLKAADNQGNDDAMEEVLVEAAQAAEANVTASAAEANVTASAAEANVTASAAEANVTASAAEANVTASAAEANVTVAEAEINVTTSAAEADVTASAVEANVTASAANVTASAAEANVTASAAEANVIASAAEADVTASAVEADVTASAVEADVTASAVEADVTASAVEADVTASAVEADVTASAVEADVTASAVEADVTASETNVTVSAAEDNVTISEINVTISAAEDNVTTSVAETNVASSAAEDNVTASTSCLETADIADTITTSTDIATTTITSAADESVTTTSTDPTNVLTSSPDIITVIPAASESPMADAIAATEPESEEAAALPDAEAVEDCVVIKSDKVIKTYSEVACNTEDSDAIDDPDDSEDEDEGPQVVIVTPKSSSSNSIIVIPTKANSASPNPAPLKLVRNMSHRLPARRLNDELKKESRANDLDEVQSAVNNLKSEVNDIEMPDDFATLTSMIQRRQAIGAGEGGDIPVPPTEGVSSSAISIKRDYEEMEDGEMEEGEIIKEEECVSLNSSLVELETSKGFRKIKGKRGRRKKQLSCSICGALFGGQVSLQIHMSTHSGLKPFSCDVCGKRFTERKYVRIHMRRHTGEKPYLCSICGKGFPRTQSLQSHMMSHEKGDEDPQKCDMCHRPFASESRLHAHMEAKHPAVPKVYKCAECNRVFTAMRSLKRHIEAHMGLKRYECQHCGRRFLRKEYLRSHATQHTGQVTPLPKRKKTNLPCPQLKITVGSNTYSVFTSDAASVTQEDQETWVAAELVQDDEQIQDPNETARATESVEQSVEAPLFFIAPNQVEYEVECTSSGGTELTEADLTAINILAQATLNTPTALPLT